MLKSVDRLDVDQCQVTLELTQRQKQDLVQASEGTIQLVHPWALHAAGVGSSVQPGLADPTFASSIDQWINCKTRENFREHQLETCFGISLKSFYKGRHRLHL